MKKRNKIDVSKYCGYFDVVYSPASPTCTLDIFLPKDTGLFPVIISIHGGAFKKCDKRDKEMIFDMLEGLKRGYAVVGVNYRLSGEAQFPEPVKDVKQAIRFIKDHANEYGLDKNRIVVWGGSAGGYFALMSGLIHDEVLFDAPYSSKTSSKVQGVVSWFPPVNFLTMDNHLKESGLLRKEKDHSDDYSPESLFIGGPILKNTDKVLLANPESYIKNDMCPMFIQHGRVDKIVPYQQSQEFVNKAKKVSKNKLYYEILDEADHGDSLFSTKENLEKVYQFIDTCFK